MSNVIPFRKKEPLSYDDAVEAQRQYLLTQKAQSLIKEAKADSGVFMCFNETGMWNYYGGKFPKQENVRWAFDQTFKSLYEEMKKQEGSDD